MRHDGAVVGFGDGRDLLAVGQAAGEGHVRPHVLRAAVGQELLEFPDGVQAFPVPDGYADPPGDFALGHDTVDLDGVLDEIEVEFGQRVGQGHGGQRGQLAVDLHDEIHVGAAAFAGRRDEVPGGADHPVQGHVLVAARQGVELERRETFRRRVPGGFEHGFRGAAATQQVQPDPVPAVPTEQFPDRNPEVLALDVPQGDVDGADGPGQGASPEGRHAVEILPVMLDAERVLPDQVVFEPLHDLVHGFGITPAGRLSHPGKAAVGPDAD